MPRAKAGTAPAKKPRVSKNSGHVLAEKFPNGEMLRDLCKKNWRLGDVIGQGGFGLIYLASDQETSKVGPDANYVVKIEPISNGPLFCEMHFYQRVAKPEIIDKWIQSQKLKYLGIPKYIASGQHVFKGTTYRFMVMQRFGTDLQLIFEGAGKQFSKQTVFALALRLIDALEYLHDNHYVHADVKAANCLLGYKNGKVEADVVFLVDYGLAFKYAPDGDHKPYKEEPKKAHDGTIEFTSRDAHKGVDPSRRADMEILGYCLLQWLCGRLPWEDKLADKNYVADSKHKYMNDISSLMKKCFPNGNAPAEISSYLTMVSKLDYEKKPDYSEMRKIFTQGLADLHIKDTWKLALPIAGAKPSTPMVSPKKAVKRKIQDTDTDGKQKKAETALASPRTNTPNNSKAKPPRQTAKTTPAKPGAKQAPKQKPVTPSSAAKKKSPVKKVTKSPTAAAALARKVGAKTIAGTLKSPALSRLASPKGSVSPGINNGPKAKLVKSPAATPPAAKKRKVVRKKNVMVTEMAVQTSPGLKKNS